MNRISLNTIISSHRTTFLFSAVFLCVFSQQVLFHWCAFGGIILSSLWHNPWAFWGFYLPKIASAIVVAAMIFLFRNRRWILLPLLVIDVWLIANLMYIRSYGMVVDAFSLSMIGNLRGFEGSLLQYLHITDLAFPLLTLLLLPLIAKEKCSERSLGLFVYWILVAYSACLTGQYGYASTHGGKEFAKSSACFELFSRDTRQTIYGMELTCPTKQTSILHTMMYDVVDAASFAIDKFYPYHLSDCELAQVSPLLSDRTSMFDTPLIIIIVESFESWVFTEDVMPCLSQFVDTHHVLYADKITSQVRGGMSADGQMIVNTGLLPTLEGAACYRFPLNTYPAIMKQSVGRSVVLLPHEKDVWNQEYMSKAYGYDTTVVCSAVDSILFPQVLEYLHAGYQNVQLITMSTHTPFTAGASLSNIVLPDSIPEMASNYMKAMSTLDHGLNILLEKVDTDSLLQHATIVITGDHKIFNEEQRLAYGLPEGYCPLVVYSPNLSNNMYYSDVAYQMDIFQTLTDVLDINPVWTGLGVSLLDDTYPVDRRFNPMEALELSDKIHRSNFFNK